MDDLGVPPFQETSIDHHISRFPSISLHPACHQHPRARSIFRCCSMPMTPMTEDERMIQVPAPPWLSGLATGPVVPLKKAIWYGYVQEICETRIRNRVSNFLLKVIKWYKSFWGITHQGVRRSSSNRAKQHRHCGLEWPTCPCCQPASWLFRQGRDGFMIRRSHWSSYPYDRC